MYPPPSNPIFVYTDIESSSALWAIERGGDGIGTVMQHAQDLHDGIMRGALTRHEGYEIATCGDSFQLAFPCIRRAVEYCMDVQLQLLGAPWPKQLHGRVTNVKKHHVGCRLVFCGLRVRMAIHDAHVSDGPLLLSVHATTGKIVYTGVSEMIARDITDIGHGGQIIVTERVAEWIESHTSELKVDISVRCLGLRELPHLNMKLTVFDVLPTILNGRRRLWHENTDQ